MIKKIIFYSLCSLWISGTVSAQTISGLSYERQLHLRGEVYFSFSVPAGTDSKTLLNQLGRFISIDHKKGTHIFAYANRHGFQKFLSYHVNYKVQPAPSMLLPRAVLDRGKQKNTSQWNYYPSYPEYLKLMDDFQTNYPQLCELVNIGQSVQGRQLLFIHLKPADSLKAKPLFMYTATMHGDETTPYVLMLHLIDYLLKNYGKIPEVTRLLDSVDIWINPLANPDGTYAGGDSSVYGATRFNANSIDLNRNYPDPADGDHPDGQAWQPETQAFINFASTHHFVLSCNMHTGSEVANYPWDTWPRLHADNDWWQQVCRQYADTVHAYAPAGYLTDLNDGITNGYVWYRITGGRQDYMNYFRHDREFTLEMSRVKMPDPGQLPGYWEDNYRSLIDYMEQTLYGIRGIVFDSLTRSPLEAKIIVAEHDTDHSEVYSSLPSGWFYRPIAAGNYTVKISAKGYFTKTIKGINISNDQSRTLSVALKPSELGVENHSSPGLVLYPNPAHDFLRFKSSGGTIDRWEIFDATGKLMREGKRSVSTIKINHWPPGIYFIRIKSGNKIYDKVFQHR